MPLPLQRLGLPRPQRGQSHRFRGCGQGVPERSAQVRRARPLRLFRPRSDPRRGPAGGLRECGDRRRREGQHRSFGAGTGDGTLPGLALRAEIEARGPDRLDDVTAQVADALAARFGAGPVENRMSALVVTAWR